MKKFLLPLLLAVTGCFAAESQPPAADFTIVALPDTQFYCRDFPHIFQAQTDWIIAQRTNRNIVYVLSLGDIVNDGDARPEQWLAATNALYRLESPALTGLPEGIPYGVVPGNHDHVGGVKNYDKYFGVERFAKRSYYGGHFGNDNRNHYDLLRLGGMDFLFLHLDFDRNEKSSIPYAEVEAWADGVLKAHPQHRAVVISHDLLTTANQFDPRGQAIYEKLKGHPNFFLMLCGHHHGEGFRKDVFEGRTVFTCLSDYQGWTNGGNGYLRLYQFSPTNDVIRVQTYSPTLTNYLTGPKSQFEMPYRMAGSASGTPK